MENLKTRIWLAIAGIVLIAVFLMPNFINTEKVWWPTDRKLNYGLDIQGGLHLVMGVDVAGVVRESATRQVASLKVEFEREKIAVSDIVLTAPDAGEFEIKTTEVDRVKELMDTRYSTMLQMLNRTDSSLKYHYYESYLTDFKQKVIQQGIETIRNRIDEFGVAEPSIQQQGTNRILVQLPGMADADRAKQLVNTAAKLDFMLVSNQVPPNLTELIANAETAGNYTMKDMKYSAYVDRLNKDLAGQIPENTMVLFERSENAQTIESGRIPYLLQTNTNLGGDALTDAFVSFDQYGVPEVALRFNPAGTNAFRDLTTANVGRQMAIVLDKVVKTAPNIQTAIGNGEARITLNRSGNRDQSLNEAKMISTSLRAGALPAALEQLEERRVGPSLGADAIKKAQMGTLAGAFLIFLFIAIRYRTMGIISDLVLGLNITAVLALLTSLGATLTLPGIAGIALTVGFAVDANVLINERIREELAKGTSFLFAVKEGYNRAMSAILDANITTAATAMVLLYFGTGPVRGFAVTLLIGITTTMFANVFVSKVIVDVLTTKFGVKKLSV
jgi:preprotein translocase subunit SecD